MLCVQQRVSIILSGVKIALIAHILADQLHYAGSAKQPSFLLLFLRPEKVGSTSVMSIIHDCAFGKICDQSFHYMGAQLCYNTSWDPVCSGQSDTSAAEGDTLVGTREVSFDNFAYMRQLQELPRPAALSIHAPYLPSLLSLRPILMTMLRDPMARCISLFNYVIERFVCTSHPKYLPQPLFKKPHFCSGGATNLTQLAENAFNWSALEPDENGVVWKSKIFEGSFTNAYYRNFGTISLSKRSQSTDLAIKRLQTFAWVGILEKWHASISLLPLEIPAVFSSLDVLRAQAASLNVANADRDRGYAYIYALNGAREQIRKLLASDYEIYTEELQRLETRSAQLR